MTSSRTRGGVDHTVAQEHKGDPDDVVRPPGTRGQLPADILVGEPGQVDELGQREADRAHDEGVVGSRDHLGPLPGRHLEHERPRVVRHATEKVETP